VGWVQVAFVYVLTACRLVRIIGREDSYGVCPC
jgi:hypothetical protein